MPLYNCRVCDTEFKSFNKNPICCCKNCMDKYKRTEEYRQHLSMKKKSYTPERQAEIDRKYEETMLKRYGVKHNWASKDDNLNGKGTTRKKYGGVGGGSTVILKNIKASKKARYGNECWCNSEKYKKTWANKTEEERQIISSARSKGILKKKGLYYSKDEQTIFELLKTKYSVIQKEYRSKEYPFACDFYIPGLNLYIEYNGLWTHGGKPYNINTDILKLAHWKEKSLVSRFYKNAIYVWTDLDVRKRNIAKTNNLNWIEFFNIEEFKIWFNNL